MSKAQLSRHVSQLENLLGIQLLHRTTRSVLLTEQGRQFFLACEGIEEGYAEAIHHLNQDFHEIKGILKITAPIDFGIQFLPRVINDFSRQYPGINIRLSLSNQNENLTRQDYDLAIRIARKLPDSSLRMSLLMKFKRIICASPQYVKDHGKPKKLDELKNHVCITSTNRDINTIYPHWQFIINNKLIGCRLERFIEIDSLFAQLELIKLGTGIGRLPDYFIQRELKAGMIVELFPQIEKPDIYVYVLYPDVKVLPKKTRAFIDFIKDHYLLHSKDCQS